MRGLRLSGGQYRRLLVTNGSVAVGPKWLESSSTTPTKEVGTSGDQYLAQESARPSTPPLSARLPLIRRRPSWRDAGGRADSRTQWLRRDESTAVVCAGCVGACQIRVYPSRRSHTGSGSRSTEERVSFRVEKTRREPAASHKLKAAPVVLPEPSDSTR